MSCTYDTSSLLDLKIISVLNCLFDGGGIMFLSFGGPITHGEKYDNGFGGCITSVGALLFAMSSFFWSVAVRVADTITDTSRATLVVPSTRFSHFEKLVSTRNLEEFIQNNVPLRFSQRL